MRREGGQKLPNLLYVYCLQVNAFSPRLVQAQQQSQEGWTRKRAKHEIR